MSKSQLVNVHNLQHPIQTYARLNCKTRKIKRIWSNDRHLFVFSYANNGVLRDHQIGSGEHYSCTICQSSWTWFTKPPFCTFWWELWTMCQSSWTLFTKPPFCTFWWTLFVNNLPKFVNNVHQTPFLHFLVNTIREQFAKVREQCLQDPLFAILVTMFVNNLPVREHC